MYVTLASQTEELETATPLHMRDRVQAAAEDSTPDHKVGSELCASSDDQIRLLLKERGTPGNASWMSN